MSATTSAQPKPDNSAKTISVAALQSSFTDDTRENVKRVTELVREAAGRGAQLVVPPELFEGLYFPREQRGDNFAMARPLDGHLTIRHFRELAHELEVAIPISFFEQAGPTFYNSVAMVDADGALLGTYRKSHIPDGPGYQEKYYFRPGDTGFKAWQTRFGRVGVGICWDQWFPECARALALEGADVIVYPTAIGSEPAAPDVDTKDMWQRVMIGHAVANIVGVVAANRVGSEGGQTFYGHSFVSDWRGELIAELSRKEEGVAVATLSLSEMQQDRAGFGFFRDRRPDLYRALVEK